MMLQLIEDEPTAILTIQQAKQMLIAEGVDPQTIDWASYPRDITIREWLQNEYGISLSTLKEKVGVLKGVLEEMKAEGLKPKDTSLNFLSQLAEKSLIVVILGKRGSGRSE